MGIGYSYIKKARFHIRYNPNQPFWKTQLPASFRLAWRLCVWKCSWTNSCYRSYEYTSCEIFACNSLFKLNIVQRVKMYFCFLAKRIIICWSIFSVMPINVRRLCLYASSTKGQVIISAVRIVSSELRFRSGSATSRYFFKISFFNNAFCAS